MARRDREDLLLEAADLVIRLSDRPYDQDLRRERDDWLARGPAERDAFRKAELAWGITAPTEKRTRRRGLRTLAAAAALFLAVYLGSLSLPLSDHVTSTDDRTFLVGTGDRLHLDAGSSVDERVDPSSRRFLLRGGGVFADVSKDPRPFVIEAGDVRVEALGTRFAVDRLPGRTEIAVAEGRVRVQSSKSTHELDAGDRLTVDGAGAVFKDRVAPDAVAAWRGRHLVVEHRPLAEIATLLDRRLSGRVILASADIGAAKVSGSFDLDRPLSALRVLAATQNARVVALQPAIIFVLPDF
ncbi:MAG: FecR domain-containing protein [Pseudomonadota bacterium]